MKAAGATSFPQSNVSLAPADRVGLPFQQDSALAEIRPAAAGAGGVGAGGLLPASTSDSCDNELDVSETVSSIRVVLSGPSLVCHFVGTFLP